MRTLQESLFDIDDNIKNIDKDIKICIKQFLKDNFKGYSNCKISRNPNGDSKYEVSSKGPVEVKNKQITSLTNGLFIWTNVSGNFYCEHCNSLKSLEGAPEKVEGDFYCDYCNSLKSLKGAPKEVHRDFICNDCGIEFTKEDVKKVSNVNGIIRNNKKLK